jgi:signal transduction histidine kinase
MRRFTADAAHELRTPLAVIRNEAEIALRQPRTGAEYGQALESVLEESIRLSRMADELLFLCRQDAGLNPRSTGEVELAPLLEGVVGNMRLVAQEKGVSLTIETPDGSVRADAGQLRRVFYNLIDNAVKYTPAGGHVRVSLRLTGGECIVTVSDTGVGIHAEHLPRVFERFYRADPSRAESGGAGLGLAICRSIVSAVGGAVSLESAPGEGTTARVSLPATRSAEPAMSADSD